jgi:enoyl-CoA hydratase/carnithine racemase
MPGFEEYHDRYETIRFELREGILQVTLHSGGDSLVWGERIHSELTDAFAQIASDADVRAVILTGTGNAFCDGLDLESIRPEARDTTPLGYDSVIREGRSLLLNYLSIGVPVVAAVNGPARYHAEIPALADVVIASESALFQDAGHFANGVVPGDGVHVAWPHLLGPNRGRVFLLTGQVLSAEQAQEWGVVSEVVSSDELLPRAWEVARLIAARPILTIRYSKALLSRELERTMRENLSYGLALQGLGSVQLKGWRMSRPGAAKDGPPE